MTLRTRAEALTTRAGSVEPVLSELRRRFSAACWQDLQPVPEQAVAAVHQAEAKLKEAATAREEQRWPDATALLSTVRALLNSTDEAVSAAGDRLRRLNAVSKDPQQEIDRTRFALRDAQRLAMAGRNTPDPRHARPLDDAVARLDRAVAGLEGGIPTGGTSWWRRRRCVPRPPVSSGTSATSWAPEPDTGAPGHARVVPLSYRADP